MTIPLVNNFVGVQLPGDCFGPFLYKNQKGHDRIVFSTSFGTSSTGIPDNAQYKLICVWPKVSEEEAGKIVELAVHMEDDEILVKDGWWNYADQKKILPTALASLQSLLTSKGLSGTVAILITA